MNKELIPAFMPQSIFEIESAALSVRNSVKTMQLDFMDGKYVKATSWPFTNGGKHDLDSALKGEFALPQWENLDYEFDLMVSRPENNLEQYLALGPSRIIFHLNSVHDWNPIQEIDEVSRNFIKLGVAITVRDNLEKVYELLDNNTVDFVQCMGIEKLGFQGEPFDQDILSTIEKVRAKYPNVTISIDGGVNSETIAELQNSGVNVFVAGSAVFGHGIAEENIHLLSDIVGIK